MICWVLGVALALLAGGCAVVPGAAPAPDVAGPQRSAPLEAARPAPAGAVTVAYPDPVGSWLQDDVEDLAAGDLAALWSLPLYRTDPLGRPVPGLARAARVVADGDPWTVEVDLATGAWSDGTAVTAHDVVATAEALAAARPVEWTAWRGADAVDDTTVQLHFDRPFAGWSGLLSRPPGVLPAPVLAEGGLAAYADDLPVTGGWFQLSGRQRGLRATFTAHATSPLGAPALTGIEVLVVPSHDVALGLLGDGDVDVVLGHVAIDPSARREQVPGVVGDAVFGGTRFELVWSPEGGADIEVRRAAARLLDPTPFVEGLLRDMGRPPAGLVPGLTRLQPPPDSSADGSVRIQVLRTVEGLGLLGRRLQADLQTAGVETSLVRVDPPQHLTRPIDVDGRLRVVRASPGQSLAVLLDRVGLEVAPGLSADATGTPTVDPMGELVAPQGPHRAVAEVLTEDPRVLSIAEVAVTHVWHPDRVAGIDPSGWPGLGMWNVGAWREPLQ